MASPFLVLLVAAGALAAIENPKSEVAPISDHQPSRSYSSSYSSSSSSFHSNSGGNNGNVSHSYNHYHFMNGDCIVTDGEVSDNGNKRPITESEKQEIVKYEKDMQQYNLDFMKSMQENMQNMFRQMFQGFNFGFEENRRQPEPVIPSQPVLPQMPLPPCFCESCKQDANRNSEKEIR
uniref:CB1 cannabinoid receptor-interacting protein 1 n=1 Tax=Steinernema glaseri TaxID=37863 RepID=A0A1I7ZEK0_9BILA